MFSCEYNPEASKGWNLSIFLPFSDQPCCGLFYTAGQDKSCPEVLGAVFDGLPADSVLEVRSAEPVFRAE